MNLTPRELDKLHVFMTAELARKRKARGLKLKDGGDIDPLTKGDEFGAGFS